MAPKTLFLTGKKGGGCLKSAPMGVARALCPADGSAEEAGVLLASMTGGNDAPLTEED